MAQILLNSAADRRKILISDLIGQFGRCTFRSSKTDHINKKYFHRPFEFQGHTLSPVSVALPFLSQHNLPHREVWGARVIIFTPEVSPKEEVLMEFGLFFVSGPM